MSGLLDGVVSLGVVLAYLAVATMTTAWWVVFALKCEERVLSLPARTGGRSDRLGRVLGENRGPWVFGLAWPLSLPLLMLLIVCRVRGLFYVSVPVSAVPQATSPDRAEQAVQALQEALPPAAPAVTSPTPARTRRPRRRKPKPGNLLEASTFRSPV